MANRDPGAERAMRILTYIGCDCSRVPEGATRTPDLLCTIGSTDFFVEVKSRRSDPELVELLRAKPHEMHTQHVPLVARQRVVNRARDAYRQLSASSAKHEFLIFYYLLDQTVGRAAEATTMEHSLHGMRQVLLFRDGNKEDPQLATAYLSSRAGFCRMPKLDALIVDEGSNLWLTVNWAGARVDDFRQSDLYRELDRRGAVRDHTGPQHDDAARPILVPPDVPRDELMENAWIAEATGASEVLTFAMQSISVTTGLGTA